MRYALLSADGCSCRVSPMMTVNKLHEGQQGHQRGLSSRRPAEELVGT